MTCSTCTPPARKAVSSGAPPHGTARDTASRFAKHLDRSAWTSTAALESWISIAAVDDFALCDPAQYIRIFPRLLPRTGTVPVALRAHITRCLAVLAWRSRTNRGGAPMAELCATASVTATDILALGEREHHHWFRVADPSPSLTGFELSHDGPVDEREAFALVDMLRREIDGGMLRPFDPDAAASFAFTTGIHPAYLWPEALLSHEFYAAVGWLGHLWRRRRADMPADLAEYFADVVDLGADGAPRVRDRPLARFLPDAEVIAEIRRAVGERQGGARAVAVWPDTALRAAAAASVPARGTPRHDGRPS